MFVYTHALCIKSKLEMKMASGASGAKKVSDVWTFYKKLHDRRKAVCTICNKEFAYLGGTTNLRNHLASKHSTQYCPDIETSTTDGGRKKSSLDGFVRPVKCSDTRAKCITDRVTQMIVEDLRPIRMIECDGFRCLMKYLEPGYVLPSRKQLST